MIRTKIWNKSSVGSNPVFHRFCFTSLSDLNRQTFPAPSSPPIGCKTIPKRDRVIRISRALPYSRHSVGSSERKCKWRKMRGRFGSGGALLRDPTQSFLRFSFFFFFQSAATIALFSIALHFTTSTPGTTLASIFVLAWFFDYLYSFFFPQYSIKMCFKRA